MDQSLATTATMNKAATTKRSLFGDPLRSLCQLIPDPDYRGIGDQIRRHADASRIERLLCELPSGVIMVQYEERQVAVLPSQIAPLKTLGKLQHGSYLSVTAKIPAVRMQIINSGLPFHELGFDFFSEFKVGERLISQENEQLLCRFYMDIGFSEKPDHQSDIVPIEVRYFNL